jgi:hypothetical protein
MSSPLPSPAGALLPAQPYRATPARDKASLALAIISGLAGALNEPVSGFAINVAIPVAFSVGLARYAVSLLRDADLEPLLAKDVGDVRRRVRVASRHVYFLLYGVVAAKELQSFLSSPQGGPATSEAMHSLWPYLAGGLFSLVLIRSRALSSL